VLFAALCCAQAVEARGQAVEVFAGHQAATADVLFFEYVPNRTGQPTPWLLFHRSRALVDYDIDTDARRDLPQFGMTNAVSFNPRRWRGLAPVAAVSLTSASAAAKLGVQYARVRPTATVFGWVVVETASQPTVDLFVLARYTRPLTADLGLFSQIETIGIRATADDEASTLTLRSRLGVSMGRWQVGAGADLGRGPSAASRNLGLFLRHAF
jgi:hypothetical protein